MNNIKCGLLSEIKSILINHYDERLKCELTKTALINQWLHAVEDRINTHGEEDQILQDLPHQLRRRLNSLSTGDDVAIDLDPSDFTDIFIPALAPRFSFIDVFAGIGGMRIGAQNNNGVCVFTSEFDSYAQKTYALNFGEVPQGDITKIDETIIPAHDLLIAGFPCQPFSYSGKCEGFADKTKGTLFFDVLRVLKVKRPKVVLLENVKGFLSHQEGQTMKIALEALRDAGYLAYWKVLNSHEFGVPQKRERWYCIAIREDIATKEYEFPKGDRPKTVLRDIVDQDLNDRALALPYSELEKIKYHFDNAFPGVRVKHDSSKYEPHTKKGRFGVYSYQKEDGSLRFHVGDKHKTQIQEAFYTCLDTYSPTIIAHRVPKLWDLKRKLSVREALRLQGFPESYRTNASNTQAFKQAGNSVTVNVIDRLIAELVAQGFL